MVISKEHHLCEQVMANCMTPTGTAGQLYLFTKKRNTAFSAAKAAYNNTKHYEGTEQTHLVLVIFYQDFSGELNRKDLCLPSRFGVSKAQGSLNISSYLASGYWIPGS